MNNKARKWYLLAYDIREPKRLQRTHAFVKKKGVRLQKSVYLVRASEAELDEIRKGIRERTNSRKDDVRLYPIRHPGVLWGAGRQQDSVKGLYAPTPEQAAGLGPTIRKLFVRRKK